MKKNKGGKLATFDFKTYYKGIYNRSVKMYTPNYTKTKYLVKLLPEITWKAGQGSNESVALGEMVGKRITVSSLLLCTSGKVF